MSANLSHLPAALCLIIVDLHSSAAHVARSPYVDHELAHDLRAAADLVAIAGLTTSSASAVLVSVLRLGAWYRDAQAAEASRAAPPLTDRLVLASGGDS